MAWEFYCGMICSSYCNKILISRLSVDFKVLKGSSTELRKKIQRIVLFILGRFLTGSRKVKCLIVSKHKRERILTGSLYFLIKTLIILLFFLSGRNSCSWTILFRDLVIFLPRSWSDMTIIPDRIMIRRFDPAPDEILIKSWQNPLL